MATSAYENESLTIAQVFKERVNLTPNKTAYLQFDQSSQSWQEYSWTQLESIAAAIQQWFIAKNISPGERVALMLPNSIYWVAIDQAAAGLGIITVPLYPNDREDNVHYILEKTECHALIIDGHEQLELSKNFLNEIASLKCIVSLEPIANSSLQSLTDLIAQHSHDEFQCDYSDCNATATIVFTSGTTGKPKGVMLSHRNVLSNAAAASRQVNVTLSDRLLSFLPLSHTFERTVGYYAPLIHGAEVVYNRSIDQLGEDLQTMRPTVLISVPRIYERVYDRIQEQLQNKSSFAQKLFEWTHTIGYQKFCCQQNTASWSFKFLLMPLLDRLVAKKIRARLGGKLKYAVAGGAAFSRKLNAFYIGMGINVLQGYGMTESSPVISTNCVEKNIIGSVGKVLDNLEVKFSEVGELLVRGPSIMQGYWDNPEATANAVTSEGWLHTGDIARLEDDVLTITGRVKEIIVLSNGEKIPPHDVEHAICLDTLFDQTIVIGERKPFLSAIVVLNTAQCELEGIDLAEINSEKISAMLLQRISRHMSDFPGYAQIYKVTATIDPWEIENGLLTPTLKIKREKVKELFAEAIESMYSGH